MEYCYIRWTALIRGNIIFIKILNTKALLSLVALCQGHATLYFQVDGSRGFMITKDNCIIV
jgi:hypothetical protein